MHECPSRSRSNCSNQDPARCANGRGSSETRDQEAPGSVTARRHREQPSADRATCSGWYQAMAGARRASTPARDRVEASAIHCRASRRTRSSKDVDLYDQRALPSPRARRVDAIRNTRLVQIDRRTGTRRIAPPSVEERTGQTEVSGEPSAQRHRDRAVEGVAWRRVEAGRRAIAD